MFMIKKRYQEEEISVSHLVGRGVWASAAPKEFAINIGTNTIRIESNIYTELKSITWKIADQIET